MPTDTGTPTPTPTDTPTPTSTVTPSPTSAGTATPTALPSSVPTQYQTQYAFLASKLDAFDPGVPAAGAATQFGGELYLANSIRGSALLSSTAFTSIDLQLNRLQELGVKGVTVAIDEDVLGRSAQAASYLAFYEQLAADVKSRGLRLVVESDSSIVADYSTLTFDQYEQSRLSTAQQILTYIQPDYLSIGNEPTTEEANTGYTQISTPAGYQSMLVYLLSGLQRGNTLVGAGQGTWEDPTYESLFVQLNLDFIGIHVYPVGHNYLQNVVDFSNVAHQNGKRVVLDEAWLYKVTDTELMLQPPPSIVYARDVFSFWAPLDQEFLQKIVAVSRVQGMDYASPFWTQYLFAYLDYNATTATYTTAQLDNAEAQAAVMAMVGDQFTSTGQYYQSLITTP